MVEAIVEIPINPSDSQVFLDAVYSFFSFFSTIYYNLDIFFDFRVCYSGIAYF